MTGKFGAWTELIERTRALAALAEDLATTSASQLTPFGSHATGDFRDPCDEICHRALAIAELTQECRLDSWRRQHDDGTAIADIAAQWGVEIQKIENALLAENNAHQPDMNSPT